ncbi:hypothetical protein LCGC14_1420920 [marine sediment metagenome]|uniref:Uncharacterized protein n=1 Tax=marine sediment metagenome TaxID=412755 RepID=A0A0F9KCN2_9ZZZZ
MAQRNQDPRLLPRLPSTPPPRLLTPRRGPAEALGALRLQAQRGILGAQPGDAPVTAEPKKGSRNLLDRLFGSDSGVLSEGERKAGRKSGLLALGTSLLKSSAPRRKGTGSFAADIGEAIEAGRAGAVEGLERRAAQQQQAQQQALLRGQKEVMQRYVGLDTSNPNVLQDMFGDMLTSGNYQAAGQIAEVLKSQGAQLKTISLGDSTVMVNPFTGKEVARFGTGPDAQVKFAQANTLFGKYAQQTSDHAAVALSFRKLAAAANDPTPAGDLAMIFAFMKIIDPGSVVRESEFATAASTGSAMTRLQAFYTRISHDRHATLHVRRTQTCWGRSRALRSGGRVSLPI